MLTAQQQSDVRRFAGYPLLADQTASDSRDFAYGWVLPGVMQTLFHRLNNLRAEEEATLTSVYLTNLTAMETALYGAGLNMGTDIAAVWTRNRTEVADRAALFNKTRRDMCAFIGIPPGPSLGQGGGRVMRA